MELYEAGIMMITFCTQLLLNEKEEIIVREIYQELFNRQAFDTERFYFAKPELSKLTITVSRIHCCLCKNHNQPYCMLE